MDKKEFKALVVEENNGVFNKEIKSKQISHLPDGDLLIKVHYSSLNYKDALSASGNRGVTRTYPHTPGIDAVGTVESSKSDTFKVHDEVIVTSYDLGMNTAGGFGQYIRAPQSWALKLPKKLSMKEAMTLGTAGLTAGMCVQRLVEKVRQEDGEIVVSGATGGVGALSISILKKLGYRVAAITGKESAHNYLTNLGVDHIIARHDFESLGEKPLLKTTFAGGIDAVGGTILQNMIKSTNPMGVVTCCGNVASPKLNLTVFPFILRGVSLIGIDSQNYPMREREQVWNLLSDEWKPDKLVDTCTEINLGELANKIDLILNGKLKGRTVVNMWP
ncbi:UNVERIFIED_CONTAM: hypothetical protein GTU68_006951 [Idotea baltica]|nr:hypothetical protein [Idotea baltica]